MGLIVVSIKHLLFVLQEPILIGWDWNVAFNKLLCEVNYFLIVLSTGMKICVTWHVLTCRDGSLAHECLAVVSFISGFMFRVCIHVYSSCSWFMIELGMAWCGVTSWRILLRSHVNHIGTWLNQSCFSSWFKFKWENNLNKIIKIVLYVSFDVIVGFW